MSDTLTSYARTEGLRTGVLRVIPEESRYLKRLPEADCLYEYGLLTFTQLAEVYGVERVSTCRK